MIKISDIRPIHPFPARMAPSIVWDFLPDNGKSLRVLDPMTGSGTTLVSARAKGHQAIGCDTDPLALLIARAWCSDVYSDKLLHSAKLVLEKAKSLAGLLSLDESYPFEADDETKKFLDFWFDAENRRQLTALAKSIADIPNLDEQTLLWCAFSQLIITKRSGVSLAMDVSHSRPHKKYQIAPVNPFARFLQAVEHINKKAPFRNGNIKTPAAIIKQGDARKLPFENSTIDTVITSPPYLNAIDYIRGHKLSLVWMGYSIKSLRILRSGNIGAESYQYIDGANELMSALERMGDIDKLDKRYHSMIMRYLNDMYLAISECKRVLRDDGHAVLVIGNSSLHGVYIKNSDGLVELAKKSGFKLFSQITRPIPESRRYLPPPNLEKSGQQMEKRMREEVILHFVVA